jgi:hypothetical protein
LSESLRTRLVRWGFNLFPAFWGTGARITYIADDYREVRIEVPLSWRTRNYVGTIFGGSMYGAVDGVHIVMLIKNLGTEYIVWDKAGSVRFRKPGRNTLYARVSLPPEKFEGIRARLAPGEAIERVYRVDLVDRAGTVHAEVEKTLHIRGRNGSHQET